MRAPLPGPSFSIRATNSCGYQCACASITLYLRAPGVVISAQPASIAPPAAAEAARNSRRVSVIYSSVTQRAPGEIMSWWLHSVVTCRGACNRERGDLATARCSERQGSFTVYDPNAVHQDMR